MRRAHRNSGYTILEVIIVVAIVGILSTSVYWITRPALIRQQVAEGTSQLMRDMERMRSIASKTSRDARVTINPATPNQYTLRYWSGSEFIQTTIRLPNGVQVFLSANAESITYTSPYGEINAINRTLSINPPGVDYRTRDGDFTKSLYVVGVTGKVHQ